LTSCSLAFFRIYSLASSLLFVAIFASCHYVILIVLKHFVIFSHTVDLAIREDEFNPS
jgi:hypothetical protein